MEEVEYDVDLGTTVIVNESGLPDSEVIPAIREQARLPEVAALSRWVTSNASAGGSRSANGGIFNRDRYVVPKNLFDKFRLAADAARSDDVVAGICETTEQLAFKRISVECDDLQQKDIWNQISEMIDTPQRMREAWREIFTINQCYPAILWQRKDFKVRGTGPRGQRSSRKEFKNVVVPKGITFLDPCKVVPLGDLMFGNEKLVYLASRSEASGIDEALAGANTSDLVVTQLLKGEYTPTRKEAELIQEITGEYMGGSGKTYLLDPDNVWRITSTRPDYQRFADVRMESVFELLDMKHQLRAMDRASLLGSTNAVILVKKGSDERPAKDGELQELRSQIGGTARQPIIVSDHRIEIEIITPKTDKTLAAERYNGIDSRITSRLYQILASGNYSSGTATDNSLKLFQVIAASMEARRDSIRDSFLKHVFKKIQERNDKLFTEEILLQFYPRRIALAFDPNLATFMMDLRDARDLSRDTMLAELDITEDDEAIKVKRENDFYNEIFAQEKMDQERRLLELQAEFDKVSSVTLENDNVDNMPPVSSPKGSTPRQGGRRGGGRKNGGGMNRESQRTNPPRGDDKTPREK